MSNRSTLLLEHHLKKLKLPSFLRVRWTRNFGQVGK